MDDWTWTIVAFVNSPFQRATTSQLWYRLTREPGRGDLHEAAQCGDVEAVKELLLGTKTGQLDLDEPDEDGRAPLHLALRAGSPEIVELLLLAGASPDPPSLPPPSIIDRLYILFRILKNIFWWFLIYWVLSKLGLPTIPVMRDHAKLLAATQFVAITMSYTLSTVFLVRLFPHFRPESIAESATAFKGSTSEHMLIMVIDSGYAPSYLDTAGLWEEAVSKGQTGVCQRLLDLGWDVDATFVHVGAYDEPVEVTALLYASGASHLDLVLLLLSRGADAARLDSRGYSCLQAAAMRCFQGSKKRDVEESDATLAALLATTAVQHLDRDCFADDQSREKTVFQFTSGWPLAEACRDLRPSAVQLLLEAGADPNFTDRGAVTALHVAASVCYREKEVEVVRILVLHGADVNAITKDGWTPLGLVCNSGASPPAMRLLLDAGAQFATGAGEGTSPLQMAARHDVSELQLVRMLLAHGADVHATGGRFGSPLLAVLHKPKSPDSEPGVFECVADFVARGADVNFAPRGEKPPLTTAAIHNWPRVVRLLIDNGAVIPPTTEITLNEVQSKWSRETIQVSILSYLNAFQAEIFAILLEHGAAPDGDTFFSGFGGHLGTTILGYACTFEDAAVTRLLLQHGADPNRLDPRGRHPLHVAAYAVQAEQVRLLLEHGAVLDSASHNQFGTPWHSVCKALSKQSLSLLSSRASDAFDEICRLFARQSDGSSIWSYDGASNNCLHYLFALAEETYLVLYPGGDVSVGQSAAVGVIQRFLDKHCRAVHPAALLAEDARGRTVFQIAAARGDVEVMNAIVDHVRSLGEGATVSADEEGTSDNDTNEILTALFIGKDGDGRDALHLAVAEGRPFVCNSLVDVYATLPRDSFVAALRSALQLATEFERYPIAELLQTYLPDSPLSEDELESARAAILGQATRHNMRLQATHEMVMDAISEWGERVQSRDP